MTKDEWRR